ncbi:MAG TPA: cell wall-binding repeat-containing protein [Acidothermaceae bacterium]|nr:cell wall-binding repeat-containing protein [Acidothermaceae bacterium]
MRLPRVAAVGALVAGSLVALGQSALAGAPVAQVAVGVAVAPPADLPAAVADPASPVKATVVLAPRDQAALEAFAAAVSTPTSPQFRHFLAPGEFAARFGATPTVITEVSNALRQRGLDVGPVSSNGLSIPVSGTVAAVGAAFHTSFASYRLPSGQGALANVAAPTLPADVASQVQGVLGLDQLTQATPTATAAAVAAPAAAGPTACAAASTAATSSGAYVPAQVAHHYGIDSLYATTTGRGSTVALFELEPFSAADVAAYQSCFGTSASVTVQQVDGGAGSGAGSGQAASDIENVIGLAPAAAVVVYEAPNDAASVYDQFRQIASDDAAQVVSDSWGLCEATSGAAQLAALERPLFQQMAAQGQTVLAATGDSGSEGCYLPPGSTDTSVSVWEPASQPEVTAVGGTSVATVDAADTAWNNTAGASGGGISALWPMPSYQHGAGDIADSSAAPCGAPSGQLCRETPDVSVSADPNHGSLAYYGGAWQHVGGTKTTASTWAAIVALVDASCPAGPVGFLNPALYALNGAAGAPLVDVKTGPNNDFTKTSGGRYAVRTGYDLTSGLGRPNVGTLAADLCPSVAPPGSGTMTVTPALVATSTSATLTFTYTPGVASGATSSGMVDGELDITVPGTWTLPSTTSTNSGYTTSSAGVVSIVGNTIVVRGITVPAGKTVTVTYGDTTGGAPQAQTPSFAQATVFSARSRNGPTGAPASLAISPAVRVLAPGGGVPGQALLTRVAGAERIATSIAASQIAFAAAGSAQNVVLARSDAFPDALAGVPLAAQLHGPLLLTPSAGLTDPLKAEIQRVLATGSTVYVLGGTVAVSPTVDAQLRAMGYQVTRASGASRFDTAVAIAHLLGDPSVIFEADGTNFPDALSAGPAAAITHGAVLLTFGKQPAAPTTVYLATHPGDLRYAVGGPASTSDPVAQPFVGADRYATSVLVAQQFFNGPSAVGTASGTSFPDALSGGPVAALAGGPMVLVPATGSLPTTTQGYLASIASSVLTGWLFGGTAAVSTAVADQVAQSLVLVPPPA